MGRGKTSAAIRYISDHPERKFLYITPYLSEVERVCDACDFEDPDSDNSTKLSELKYLMRCGKRIASTHSLFYRMDDAALKLAKERGYCLIVDESINPVERVNITSKDFDILINTFATIDDDGRLHWIDESYTGKFSEYKDKADSGSLYKMDNSLLYIMRPEMLNAFNEVIMMTYLFDGQYQKAYLDFFGFEYEVCGVVGSNGNYMFSDAPDDPPAVDYKNLIHIVDDCKLNSIGDGKYSLSKNWYERRSRDNAGIVKLRNNLNTFFRKVAPSASDDRLWTTFKSSCEKLDQNDRRYASSFLQMSARATNVYRKRTKVAYMCNRFVDPNLGKFFSSRGVSVNEDVFALSEMLQYIWRSAIRDNNPICLYIPSKRMRQLMLDWVESLSRGGGCNE